ncbi:MAG: hypothetical protein Fur0041_21640 [Bacteroidia bacterium]
MSKRLIVFISIIAGTILVLILGALFWWKSHTSGDHIRMIPSDAAFVGVIHTTEIAQLIDTDLMKESFSKKSSPTPFDAILSNPMESGIDPLQDVYAFVSDDAKDGLAALVLNVNSPEKLGASFKKLGWGEAQKKNDIQYYINESGIVTAWNEEACLMAVAANPDEALTACETYLVQDEKNSAAVNPEIEKFLDSDAEIGFILNNEQTGKIGAMSQISALTLLNPSTGYTSYLFNFEEDEIRLDIFNSNSGSNDPKTSWLKKTGKKIPFKGIADKEPIAWAGFHADMNALVRELEADDKMSANLTMIELGLGLNRNDLIKLMDGSVSVAFTGYEDISKNDPRVQSVQKKLIEKYAAFQKQFKDFDSTAAADVAEEFRMVVPVTVMNFGITDARPVNDLFMKAGLDKEKDFWVLPGMGMVMYFAAKGNRMIITNSYQAADAFTVNGQLKYDAPAVMKSNADEEISGWLNADPAKFPSSLMLSMQENLGTQQAAFITDLLQPFREITLSGNTEKSVIHLKTAPGKGGSLNVVLRHWIKLLAA